MGEIFSTYILPHWQFVAWAIVSMLIGQVMKSAVWTKKRAHTKARFQWVFWWAYKTFPLHPVAAGAILGMIIRNPEGADPAWAWPMAALYFGAAGALSVWLYQVLKGLAKRFGITMAPLPGESGPPEK